MLKESALLLAMDLPLALIALAMPVALLHEIERARLSDSQTHSVA
jgi:hypothetical protein